MGKITADSRTVDELLLQRYEVDYYQREYRWEKKQVGELVDDLIAKFQDSYEPGDERKKVAAYENYFLGSVVIAERDGVRFIVDGQQRLTTLTLLLVYLHHRIPNEPTLAPRIFSMKYGEEHFNINVPEREAVMRAIYRGEAYDPAAEVDASARTIWERYADIETLFAIEEKQLDGSEPVAHFTDWLLNKVVLVEIIATAEEDAYTVFETMNDRGLSLSPAEMLKGYLLSRMTDEGEREASNDLWRSRMLELIGLAKDDELDFFKAWLRARHAETIRERKKGSINRDWDHIGTGFHKWVRDQAGTIGLTTTSSFVSFVQRDFKRYSRHYMAARRRAMKLEAPHEAVFFNALNGFTLQYTLMLAPVARDDSEQTADDKMRAVADYLDIYIARRVVNYKTLAYSSVVYTMFGFMKELRAREDLDDLRAFLRTRLDELPEQFDEPTFSRFRRHQQNQSFVYNLLARMTYFVERAAAKPTSFAKYLDRSASGRYDVEHIWPDTPDAYVAQFPERFKSADQASQFRDRVGGLVLLPEKVNRSLQAKPFGEKVGKYLEDNLLAGSLHPGAYVNNPGFTSWVHSSGLPFAAVETFGTKEQDIRQELYRQLCELVWDPDRVLQ